MTDFLLPDLGEGLPDAEIVKWSVSEGDHVNEGDLMVEMSTAKAVVEVPAPFTGTVVRLHGGPGDIIETGKILISFALEGENVDDLKAAPDQNPDKPKPTTAPKTGNTKKSENQQIFILPDLGEGLPDAEIVKWCVEVGDKITEGETMVEMSTAKAVVEVPAPFSGTVTKLYGIAGDIILTGDPLIAATGGDGAEAPANELGTKDPVRIEPVQEDGGDAGTVVGAVVVGNEVKAEASISSDGIKASPAVRALARKMKVDLGTLKGTGAGNEITLGDVRGARSGTAPAEATKATAGVLSSDYKIGPSARSLAQDLGLDLAAISPTGSRRTITKRDVLAAARTAMAATNVAPPVAISDNVTVAAGRSAKAAPKVRAYARDKGIDLGRVQASGFENTVTIDDVNAALKADFAAGVPISKSYTRPLRAYEISGQAERLVGPRRVMSQAMSKSNAEVCHTSIFDEADIANWPKGSDITVRIMRSIIAASMVEPAINATYNGETHEKTISPDVHLGIAVDGEKGLFVPVIKDADKLTGTELRERLNNHRQTIADGKIKPSDMSGATLTLSNFGMIAGRFATPIISIPQVAIIGIGGLFEKLVMLQGAIKNHRMIPVSLTFDHRACTGGEAARFLAALLADLELDH
jgi:2-oxoisovalerate dehydrogenase E2 component (dihydrolipoyl transacylase)